MKEKTISSSLLRGGAAVAVAITMFLGAFAFVQPAHAQWNDTSLSLQERIAAAMARITYLQSFLSGSNDSPTQTTEATGQTATLAAASDACVDSSIWSDFTGPDLERLGDFSRVGYMAREKRIPNDALRYNVKDFGALGDGVKNDTTAFEKAIDAASANPGVIYIPEGTYFLSRPLSIIASGVVLRGAGPNKTILKYKWSLRDYCRYDPENDPNMENVRWGDPTCDAELEGFEADDEGNGPFSHSLGFIQLGGPTAGQLTSDIRNVRMIQVTEAAERGDKELVVANASNFQLGQWIVLEMEDSDPSSGPKLHQRVLGGNPGDVGTDSLEKPGVTYRLYNKIIGKTGNTLSLALPLTIDVRPSKWDPRVSLFETKTSDVGIENLRVVFPYYEVGNHHHEAGFNAIHLSSVSNCWVSNVKIDNADNPIKVRRSAFCTLEDLEFDNTLAYETATKRARLESKVESLRSLVPANLRNRVVRGEFDGHHGITITSASSHIWVNNVNFKNRFIHDITTTFFANQNVFSNISGIDLRLDHHRHSPFSNLFTKIDVGAGNDVWKSTGGSGSDHGLQTGAYSTYWNLVKDRGAVELPVSNNWTLDRNIKQDFGLKLNFVFNVRDASVADYYNDNDGNNKDSDNEWVITDKTGAWCQPNLYKAMRDYTKNARQQEPNSRF